MSKTVRITQIKSVIGYTQNQRDTLRALGLRRMNHSVEKTLNPSVEGMLKTIPHLIKVEEIK